MSSVSSKEYMKQNRKDVPMMKMTPLELFAAFWRCAQIGHHDFEKSDICARCTAHKGDATLFDLLRHARVKKDNPHAR